MYFYRSNTITITRYGVVVHNCNGYLGQFATPEEAQEFIDSMLDY